MTPTADQALLIFTRNPELGKCKTRLAATIGDQAALEVYKHLLRHTASQAESFQEADKFVYFTEALGTGEFWNPERFEYKLQQGSDLGEKMQNAFMEAFHAGYKRVVLIGSDLPDLDTQVLSDAFAALQSQKVVLGPASDGGYYLVGLVEVPGQIFSGKAWGGPEVLADTLSDLKGIPVSLLAEKNDVDRYEDIAHRPEFKPYITHISK
ncbi:hypothetical protein SAMN04490243_1484 [Robiginitalea myxolifaciens]|uniref:Glycosyltransferase n=1 Tax=Robiginitalea myxolifaciens TaxID=400055 RepID=A0A1I6GAC6_9FLAO|nr:TIGR04282 family arsenosugar biosynthesis glycosyltransferase [Robiginitalea myxolifaciens]SFR39144.1 hypothetical protein SAMN04490243_1484 [Robiginitalea myxolifaciens]